MKALFILVAALVIGGVIGKAAAYDPGYLMLSYGGHAIETSIWFALLVVVALIILLWVVVSLLRSVLSSRKLLGRWNVRRRLQGSRRQTGHGLLLMAEEEWADARRSLLSAAKSAEVPLLNYLQAAIASNHLDQPTKRDELLQKAINTTPSSAFAVQLASAKMKLDSNEIAPAIAELNALRKQAPRHQVVAQLLARAHEQREDWSALESELSNLKRLRKQQPELYARYEAGIARHKLLGVLANDNDAPGALSIWRRLDKSARLDADLVAQVSDQMVAASQGSVAADLLVAALDESWQPSWLQRYAELPGQVANQKTASARWLKSHGDDALLHLLAARCAAANSDWSSALEHAQRSDSIAPSSAARSEIARCELAMGRLSGAASSQQATA